MTGIIKVETGRLTSAAAELEGTGAQIRNLVNSMTSTVESLSGSIWSGDAATAYIGKFKGLQDDIERMQSMIREHVNDLNAMAREYEAAEAQNIGQVQGLSADVIQ